MLAAADLPGADLRLQDLRDPLPEGPFDLVFSALAMHHLDGPEKADLFARVAAVLAPGGRFVIADVVVPDDPADVVTPLDAGFDLPETVPDLLGWMDDAGLRARVSWQARDLAVLVGRCAPSAQRPRARQQRPECPPLLPRPWWCRWVPAAASRPPTSASFASGRLVFLSDMLGPLSGVWLAAVPHSAPRRRSRIGTLGRKRPTLSGQGWAAKPRLSSWVACLPGSGECSRTTPRRRPLRRAAATRQRPAASV